MASDSRTLKLAILGEVKDLSANLNKGTSEVQTFGDKLSKFGKVAGLAFAAAGAAAVAYAGKLAVDGVKAAIEDEAAQLRLAASLKNVTGATDAQIASTENYILKTSLATGVTDDELRPSLDRLVRATKDVSEAQKLQTLALNIAAGTGKSLETVTNALAKAHEGNTAALGKLGTGIDKATLKSMTFDEVTQSLSATFKDQASVQADTFDGKMRRLSVAFNEGKETVGAFILDAITPMVDFVVKNVVPAIQSFIESMGGKEGISNAFTNFIAIIVKIFKPAIEGFLDVWNKIKKTISDNREEFDSLFKFLKDYVAPLLGGALKIAIQAMGTAFDAVLKTIAGIITGIQWIIDNAKKIGGFFGIGGNPASFTTSSPTAAVMIPASSNSSNAGGSNVNITVNGAVDPISTARQINDLLNREATINGSFNRVGASLLVGA